MDLKGITRKVNNPAQLLGKIHLNMPNLTFEAAVSKFKLSPSLILQSFRMHTNQRNNLYRQLHLQIAVHNFVIDGEDLNKSRLLLARLELSHFCMIASWVALSVDVISGCTIDETHLKTYANATGYVEFQVEWNQGYASADPISYHHLTAFLC